MLLQLVLVKETRSYEIMHPMAIISFLREDLQEGRVWEVCCLRIKRNERGKQIGRSDSGSLPEKLLMEATLEAVEKHLVKALKDLVEAAFHVAFRNCHTLWRRDLILN